MTTDESPPAPEVSVAFVPRQSSVPDQWRLALRRLYPRSRSPLWHALGRTGLLMAYLGFSGYFLAAVGFVTVPPTPMALGAATFGLVLPLRLWRIKRSLLATLNISESYTVTAGPAGLTVEHASRVLLIRWPAVVGVAVNPHEVVIRFRTPDVVSVPTRAFDGDAHVRRFSGEVRSRIADAAQAGDQA